MPKPNKGEAKQDFLKRCTAELVGSINRDSDQAFAMCNAYWDDENSQRATLSLTAPVELVKKEEGKNSGFLITAYTGAVIDRWWGGRMVIDTAGIKTKAKLPVLREHERDRVVGYGVKAWKEKANLFIQGEYSAKTSDGQEVQALGEEGFPWEASIGVWPKKVKVLESDKESATVNGAELSGPLEIWTESEVREVSFVALGADDRTAAINFSNQNTVKVQIERGQPQNHKEGQIMPMTLSQLETEAPELLQEIRNQARDEGQILGRDEERARVVEILEADGDPETTRQAIKEGMSAADTFKKLFMAEKSKQADALKKLETAAPSPMGQAPATPAPSGSESPDAALARKAQERAKEKKIDMEAAMLEVAGENPDLVAKWNPAGQIKKEE